MKNLVVTPLAVAAVALSFASPAIASESRLTARESQNAVYERFGWSDTSATLIATTTATLRSFNVQTDAAVLDGMNQRRVSRRVFRATATVRSELASTQTFYFLDVTVRERKGKRTVTIRPVA